MPQQAGGIKAVRLLSEIEDIHIDLSHARHRLVVGRKPHPAEESVAADPAMGTDLAERVLVEVHGRIAFVAVDVAEVDFGDGGKDLGTARHVELKGQLLRSPRKGDCSCRQSECTRTGPSPCQQLPLWPPMCCELAVISPRGIPACRPPNQAS